jgi:hypothetical protein
MVPKYFNGDQKARPNEVSAETLQRLKTEPDFLHRVITGDERWFSEYDPENRANLRSGARHSVHEGRRSREQIKTQRQWT